MNLSFFIARRYLFSKKSHNAINIISTISVCGIAVATMAMVCVLSVFNGFEDIVEKTFNAFDPDLKIIPREGKVFDYNAEAFDKALRLDGINMVSESLEENALVKYHDRQVPVLVKGVSDDFTLISDMNALVISGSFRLREDVVDYASIGVGLAMTLGIRPEFIYPVNIYAPKRDVRVNPANPAASLTPVSVQLSGVFKLDQPKYDDEMIIIPIALARQLFRYDNGNVSSIDISLRQGASVKALKKDIQRIVGDDYIVQTRFEQQAESYRMLKMERWIIFLILTLIVLIAVFNVVGSLSMLIVEKKDDIKNLRSMGATGKLVSRIFVYEGWMISAFGMVIGTIVGLALCLVQQHFGLLQLGDGLPGAYTIDAYPVIVHAADVLIIIGVVSFVSMVTVLYTTGGVRKQLSRFNQL